MSNIDTIKRSFAQKVRRGIFQPVARHVHADVEDRMQDAVGLTWRFYADRLAR